MAEDTIVRPELPSNERAVSPREFLGVAVSLIPRAFDEHEKRNGPDSSHPQIFHRAKNPDDHVVAAEQRILKCIEAIKKVAPELISPFQEGRARLFIATHDWVQERSLKDIGTIKEQIVRDRGNNERNNTDEVVEFLGVVNDENGKIIFLNEDNDVCREVLDATIPEWVNELGTVIQKQVGANSAIEAKLAALVDIGAAGEDPEQLVREGNREFQEVRTGITRAIAEAPRNADAVPILSDEDQQYVMEQISGWLKGQINWAVGRKSRQDIELGWFEDERVINVLKDEVFNKFDESIAKTKERANVEGKTFEELLVLLDYLPLKKAP